MKLLKIKTFTDGGPWLLHNYPCPVCEQKPAVLDTDGGPFQPCWGCQKRGYKLIQVQPMDIIGWLLIKWFK